MAKKGSTQDAQVILQLYDLRREAVMRAARKFMVSEFWPQNYDEFKAVMLGYGTEQNAYARQCLTYWDMAAAMVLQGCVSEELFFATSGELYFLYAKFGKFFDQVRKDFLNPEFCLGLEELANHPAGKKRVKTLQARLAARQAAAAAVAKAGK